jgi:hypothetical protein
MNNKCPESEWGTDLNGKPRGPWQIARVLYLIDPQTLDQYTFIATNIGSTRAVDELVNKIRWVQKHRGPDVLPLLQFSTTWMPTRYGGRMRPHFQIVDWTRPNGGGGSNALEPRTPPTLPSPAAAEPAQTSAQTSASAQNPPPQKPSPQKPAPARKKPTAALELKGGIKEPSLKEDLDDEIPL